MNNPRLRVHLISEDAKAPTYAHSDDSGMDVYSVEDVTLPSIFQNLIESGYDGSVTTAEEALSFLQVPVVKVKTGISLEIPQGYEIQVRSKSGLAINETVFVLNSPATIDEGYRGELEVILASLRTTPYHIHKGQKIAQIVLAPVSQAEIIVMDDTRRNKGGFGSTGLGLEKQEDAHSYIAKVLAKELTKAKDYVSLNKAIVSTNPPAQITFNKDGEVTGYTVEES